MLHDADGTGTLVQDAPDLCGIEPTDNAEQDDLGLLGTQLPHQLIDRFLGADGADHRGFGVMPSGAISQVVGRHRIGSPAAQTAAMLDQAPAGDGEQPAPESRFVALERRQPGGGRQPDVSGQVLAGGPVLGL